MTQTRTHQLCPRFIRDKSRASDCFDVDTNVRDSFIWTIHVAKVDFNKSDKRVHQTNVQSQSKVVFSKTDCPSHLTLKAQTLGNPSKDYLDVKLHLITTGQKRLKNHQFMRLKFIEYSIQK